jgi:hypothetical protein
MPSGSVPLWVPIVVGLLGFCGVLGAQLIAGWREDRRWQREVSRENLRWQRERERQHEERRYAGRELAYGKMIGLLEEWQWVLHPAKERVIKREESLTDELRAGLRSMRDEAREALGPINLHAPDAIRRLMRDAILAKVRLTDALLAGSDQYVEMDAQYRRSLDAYVAMRTAMRRDLAID